MTAPTAHHALTRASIVGDRVEFAEGAALSDAIRDGCFFLDIPSGLDLRPGIELSQFFHLDRADENRRDAPAGYAGYRDRPDVYFDRPGFQTEHILIDQHQRARYFDSRLNAMCDAMSGLAETILAAVLRHLGTDEDQWDLITQGAVHGRGTSWFACNHYRPEKRTLGCTPHKDTGFVTVLYAPTPGLEAWNGDYWESVDAPAGCFIVNFGGSFEVLTSRLDTPVRAILHQVRDTASEHTVDDRISFAAFANPPASGDLYELTPRYEAVRVEPVEAFLRRFNETAWGDEHSDFGIRLDERAP